MRTRNKWITAVGATALAAAAVQLNPQEVTAADHIDAPVTQGDAAVDIADFYAWHTERGTIVAVITFNALLAPGDDPVYDDGVLYTVHIDNTADPVEAAQFFDNDNDNASDIQINFRFGQNDAGDWGVQVNGAPGATDETFDGPVQTPLTNGSVTAAAGLYDDPFFFDFDGFVATVMNLLDDTEPGDVAFASLTAGSAVDFFEGLNTMGIVVEFDAAMAVDGNADNFLQIWATTGVAR